MEKTEAEKILKEKLETAEKILVGIGSEWKKKEGAEEEEIQPRSAAEAEICWKRLLYHNFTVR